MGSNHSSEIISGLPEYRSNGLTVLSFEIQNEISLPDGSEFNLFNSTDGMFSSNGTLDINSDPWDKVTLFDSEYVRPDPYLHTEKHYQAIETDLFARIPTDISGVVARGIIVEIRRRTAASPVVPVAIPNREIEIITNQAVLTATVQRLPTRSSGIDDNYYVYGYAPWIINDSGTTINLPAQGIIRVELFSQYRQPTIFNTLVSSNV